MRNFIFLLIGVMASFSIHAETPWKGVWISHETNQSHPNSWYTYRTTVDIEKVPAQAMARIAADSKYWLWINGQMVVFEGSLKRGPAPGDAYYDEIDIAPYLQEGENTIAALVWYFGLNGFSHSSSGHAGFLFDCQAPGVEIISNNQWSCDTYQAYSNTDAPHPNYRMPEGNIRYDARKAIEGWNLPGEDKIKTSAMMVGDANRAPFGKLVKRPIPMWKDYGLKEYVGIEQVGDTLFCKLPYNAQITPWLEVVSNKGGDTIRIQTDNYYTGNGSTASVRCEYITRPGLQQYENLGWMSGHIVKYVIPQGVEVKALKFRETGYNTEFAGKFQCNDPFLNELWKRAARTLYLNMRDTYFDCPERERAQWGGDLANELAQSFYAFDPQAQKLATKAIREMIGWQRNDGVIFAPAPAGNWSRELPLQSLALVGWYGFYTQYYYSGDSSFVASIYDGMHRYLHEHWQIGADGLVMHRTGDWTWADWGENKDYLVLTNAWYYLAMKAEQAFAQMLGKQDDIAKIDQIMTGIEQNFDKRFWTGNCYRDPAYQGQTDDRAQAMAILAGLASPDKYPQLAEVLRAEQHAGPYMEKYVLEALFAINRPEFAIERIHKRYAEMLSYDEYTTLFEVWKYKAHATDANSNDHAWTGGPLTLLSQKVCGIAPTAPGFKIFQIAPQMGNLTEASATVSTVNGVIEAHVIRKGKTMTVTATVPEGTTAEVIFPSGDKTTLTAGTHTVKGK